MLTLWAKVDAPLTVRLDEPAERVMLLPEAMFRLATVCVACRSHTEVPFNTTSVLLLSTPVNFKVPADTVVSPV